jgi:hypothetical protein
MMTDEERHADEVNIAFQMGAEWQKKQSDSAWKGIHEGAVLAMQARINELEAALRWIAEGRDSIPEEPPTGSEEIYRLWVTVIVCMEWANATLEKKHDD